MTAPTPCRIWLDNDGDDLWHPETTGLNVPKLEALAKRICRTCPAQTACLTQALAFEADNPHAMRFGVWGGLNAAERARIAKGAVA